MVEQEVLERINRGILLRTGAYLTDDHFILSSGRHSEEYIEKALVTTEPAFTEGLGEVIAKHFVRSQVDLVLTTGYGASILGHCVAKAHPSRPRFLYAIKRKGEKGKTKVALPREFLRFFTEEARVLVVEDILTTGETINQLIRLVESLGGRIVGIGSIWNRDNRIRFRYPLFTLVNRDFPSYMPETCPLCKRGIPINKEYGGLKDEELGVEI